MNFEVRVLSVYLFEQNFVKNAAFQFPFEYLTSFLYFCSLANAFCIVLENSMNLNTKIPTTVVLSVFGSRFGFIFGRFSVQTAR